MHLAPRHLTLIVVIASLLGVASAAEPAIPPAARAAFEAITVTPAVRRGLELIKSDDARVFADQKTITVISAPTFKERKRAEYYLGRLKAHGLEDVRMDAVGNVCGVRRGTGGRPKLMLAAHLDTVFPEGTDLTVKEKDGKLHAPGISDDARGLAGMLSVIRALDAAKVRTVGDVWFCGTVGEEGLGDLRGVKNLFREHKDIDAYLAVESSETPNHEIVHQAVGSHRYLITFKGPGGHSYRAFGLPSAIHALGRAIAGIDELQTPRTPTTTFNVGVIRGGTSVNSIAAEASAEVDMRSVDNQALLTLEAQLLEVVRQAAAAENMRWGSDKMGVDIKLIGDRPAGSPSPDSSIVQSLWLAIQAVGGKPTLGPPSSTEANLPISLGIPAAVTSAGGRSEGIHSPAEWFDPADAWRGPQKVFLAILGLVGVEGVSQPLLEKRAPRG